MRILTFPRDAALLRRKARPIRDDEFGQPHLMAWGTLLGRVMVASRGLGLASTQVEEAPGGEPWAMFAFVPSPGHFSVVCNPEIVLAKNERVGPEGGLSFASIHVPLPAPEYVALSFKNTQGPW